MIARLVTRGAILARAMMNGTDFHETTQDMIFMREAQHDLSSAETDFCLVGLCGPFILNF